MRAIVLQGFGDVDVMVMKDVADPTPSRGEALVRVRAAGVNRADLLQRMGAYPPPKDASPDILGLEYAGEIEALGAGVHNVDVGDRVFGLTGGGAYAEKIVVHAETCVKIPDAISFEDAAALPEANMTAYDAMVSQAGLAAGEWVLISAVGSGVGTAAVQIARAIGARSIGTSRTEDKLVRAKELGLDVGICVQDATFGDRVLEATNGGANVVLELVGGAYVAEDLKAVAVRGRIAIVGLTAGSKLDLEGGLMMRKRALLIGTTIRARPLHEKIALAKMFEKNLVPLIARGSIKAIVHDVIPLRDAREAHTRMAANEGFGKIILRVD